RLVAFVPLARADLVDRPREVPVPLEGVHREIEVRVNNEHGSTTLRERDEPRSRGEAYSIDTSRLTTNSGSNTTSHARPVHLPGSARRRPRRGGADPRAECAGARSCARCRIGGAPAARSTGQASRDRARLSG